VTSLPKRDRQDQSSPPPVKELIPARILNEYIYCPRLAYLEWVQGEWAESFDTVEGSHAHRRVDRQSGALPEPADADEESDKIHARSVHLSSEHLGVVARIDIVEMENGEVIPVDYKKGRRPHVARGAYDPERVQVCVQGLILREHGYTCNEGALYFIAGKERVRVEFDEELIALTKAGIAGLRHAATSQELPAPLEVLPQVPPLLPGRHLPAGRG